MVASLAQLLDLLRHHGAHRIYAKKLSANDNSKNQLYLGGGFGALNVLPHGNVYTDEAEIAGSVRDRAKAAVDFYWVDECGKYHAPNANLILYPKYPEVRMSGLLQGCRAAPSKIVAPRLDGRIMFFGITRTGSILGYVTDAASPITAEVNGREWDSLGVFLELPLSLSQADPKTILLNELRRVYQRGWIASQKLAKDGAKLPYAAANGGGYTLEAELGITPNGYSEPDFMGWEVKQYGVSDFTDYKANSPVTLMTPEPTGGLYKEAGVEAFMRAFGYSDKNGKLDRINFGGIYTCQKSFHPDTDLRMTISGYDAASGKITDLDGGFALIDSRDVIAATWSFKGMMAHWNRKHAQAAYVPSLSRKPPPEYRFGASVLLCERTDFLLFLAAFAAGKVYYDPAVKMENASAAKPDVKRRSQFRIAHSRLSEMYHGHEIVQL